MCQIVSKGLQRQHAPKTMIPNTYEDGWARCSEMFGHSTEQAFCRKPMCGGVAPEVLARETRGQGRAKMGEDEHKMGQDEQDEGQDEARWGK